MELLRLEGVAMHYRAAGRRRRVVRAVDGVDLTVGAGETVGLVGESGCGKSTVARLVTRLAEPVAGRILFDGHDITHLSERRLRPYRRDLQLIFQDPYASLNPRHTAGQIVGTAGPGREVDLLKQVGLGAEHRHRYPYELSGGQRQRVAIARALAVRPRLIVADEAVSALDVSVRAQVLNLLSAVRAETGIAFLFIAHDLGVVRHFCDRIAVMYLGRVVELGSRDAVYSRPRHPYTQALLSAVPDLAAARRGMVAGGPGPGGPAGAAAGASGRIRLPGDVPAEVPSGCRFRTRCWKAEAVCAESDPALTEKASGQWAACHFA